MKGTKNNAQDAEDRSKLPLPTPDDLILKKLPGLGTSHHAIYGFLYFNREDPPTMADIREFDQSLAEPDGEGTVRGRTQIDRRVRDLYRYFRVKKVRVEGSSSPRYVLEGWKPSDHNSPTGSISGRVRAKVLAPGRCYMCGRTPKEHGVVLVVDHKLPQAWGGTDDDDNLQPLCEECNGGKQAWFASYDHAAEEIRAAAQHPEPQGRIGELLKAFRGEPVMGDMISVVASMGAFQEDWQKRLRELRSLGWKITAVKKTSKQGTRKVHTYYRLDHAEPWGPGTIRAAVNVAEHSKKAAKEAKDASLNATE